jgi:hypothetical protein
MSTFHELYGSRSSCQDEIKDYLQNDFGYVFQGRRNDDDGDYWKYANDNIEIILQNNIDLGDNVPRLQQFEDYQVLLYISLINTDNPSSDVFVQKLRKNNIELLGRIKWEGKERTVLFGDGCI